MNIDVLIGMAAGAVLMLMVVVFAAWVGTGIGRAMSHSNAKKTGVSWGYVDSEAAHILQSEQPYRVKINQIRDLLRKVAIDAAREARWTSAPRE